MHEAGCTLLQASKAFASKQGLKHAGKQDCMFVLPQQSGLCWLSASSRVDVALLVVPPCRPLCISVSDGADSCIIGSATSDSSIVSCTVCNGAKPGRDETGNLEAAILDLDETEPAGWLRWIADFHAS